MRRITLALVIAVTAVIATAGPASAALSGTQYCGPGKVPFASAWAYGKLKLKGPGDSSFSLYDLGPFPYERKGNSGPGGYWEAGLWGQGAVNGDETYSYCSGS